MTFFYFQRHFCVFALSFPGVDALKTIYLSILNGHLACHSISSSIMKLTERLSEASISLNSKVFLFDVLWTDLLYSRVLRIHKYMNLLARSA